MQTRKLFLPVLLLLFIAGCSSPSPTEQQNRSQIVEVDSTANPTFLFLSDIHLNTFDSNTVYGEDTGLKLWKNFLAKADSLLAAPNSPNFIVYTGDLPAHYKCGSNCYLAPVDRDTHNTNIKTILEGLRNLADKYHKPLFYLPGNNDALAGDYYSFADEKQQTPFSLVGEAGNPFPALNILPGDKAPCMVSSPHPTMGYYSARPVEGLRLIALNTVVYNKWFIAVDNTTPEVDRGEQLTWLAEQLKDAKAKGEKVYIAMHIPPGIDAYSDKPMWVTTPLQNGTALSTFLALTDQYHETIAGILYGHTHMEEVRRLYDTTGTRITEVAISCPGVTPQHNNNPGFKMVEYNEQNKELVDFTTFYTTPQAAYWGGGTYTFSSTYSAGKKGTIFETLSTMSLADAGTHMGTIFTVMNGAAGYDIQQGIEVRVVQ